MGLPLRGRGDTGLRGTPAVRLPWWWESAAYWWRSVRLYFSVFVLALAVAAALGVDWWGS